MDIPFTGGCVCGQVRYECQAEPFMMLKCHCRDCQQVTGGPYAAAIVVPLNAFKITKGALQHYATPSLRGGHNLRGFCPNCGSRLTGVENPERGIIGILASSLDDPAWFKPAMDIFTSEAQPWDLMDLALPKFKEYPPIKKIE